MDQLGTDRRTCIRRHSLHGISKTKKIVLQQTLNFIDAIGLLWPLWLLCRAIYRFLVLLMCSGSLYVGYHGGVEFHKVEKVRGLPYRLNVLADPTLELGKSCAMYIAYCISNRAVRSRFSKFYKVRFKDSLNNFVVL